MTALGRLHRGTRCFAIDRKGPSASISQTTGPARGTDAIGTGKDSVGGKVAGRNDISGLLAFIGREDGWHDRLQSVIDEHLDAALEAFDIDREDLADGLGEPASGALWGCGFEDFLGRRFGPESENIVDLYLRRRGWKETVLNRAYFAALRDTPVSLHEVSDVKPGASMVLRDILRGGPEVTVHEKSATRSLRQWDKIAVRVVPERKHHVISGAVLPFSAEAFELLGSMLRSATGIGERAPLKLSTEQLRDCAPIFTSAWLLTEIPRVLAPADTSYCNSDGDEVLFHDLRFVLKASTTQKKLAQRLDRIPGLSAASAKFWNWIEQRPARKGRAAGGLMLDTQMEGGAVLAGLEIKGRALSVSANSQARAARGEELVMEAAGDLVKPPLTSIRTVAQLLAEREAQPAARGADEVPPEIARQITHEYMDTHYREALDTPLPALGNKSPRQATRSASGRAKVIEWLKLLENRSARQDDSPIAEYDFAWMWVELGLEEHRK